MVDAGDVFQGLPISNFSKGADMAKAMNEVGYDAMAVGNHEFDFGLEIALGYKDQLNFPILSIIRITKMAVDGFLIRIQS